MVPLHPYSHIPKNPLIAKSTHAQIIKHGITSSDKFLANNMINMYGKCGCFSYARQLFDEMPQKDLVTWNSILAAYGSGCEVDGGNVEKGMSLFRAFSITFFGEWGDKSQLATIGLAAAENPLGVVLGGILGQALCQNAAVFGGKSLATQIPERFIALSGGILFIVFGIQSFFSTIES
ncbi:hypothetical protein CTI12_AA456430 [Artemisia annua]|uniref:GDT1 family protein n=1 Tax=Artemisia annua TaxID=35608 RepID=A0A2U1LTF4_ARTAN|nr:hypothetical protein CTI12_AA456430 [Artemisia annua]